MEHSAGADESAQGRTAGQQRPAAFLLFGARSGRLVGRTDDVHVVDGARPRRQRSAEPARRTRPPQRGDRGPRGRVQRRGPGRRDHDPRRTLCLRRGQGAPQAAPR